MCGEAMLLRGGLKGLCGYAAALEAVRNGGIAAGVKFSSIGEAELRRKSMG